MKHSKYKSIMQWCNDNNRNDLLQEFDVIKNENAIDRCFEGVLHKYWWKCKLGHSYEMDLRLRKRGCGCPYCGGKQVLKGFNDFESKYLIISKEWHLFKNNGVKPSEVLRGSGKKYWWICRNNHEYQSSPRDRGRGVGCPICFDYRRTSFAEQAIYFYVKKVYPNTINRYKDIFTRSMEIDIYIPELKVGIEFDGAKWHETEAQHQREIKKYIICKENGIYLIRVKENKELIWNDTYDKIYSINIVKSDMKELESVIKKILSFINKDEITINIEKDYNEILLYLQRMDSSLLSKYPSIAKEWNYEKNYPMRPKNFYPYSNKRVWWKCSKCGYSWKTIIATRTGKNKSNCPKCAAKLSIEKQIKHRINKNGSLFDLYPELVKEMDDSNTINPKEVLPGSAQVVKWKCSKCLRTWETRINARTLKGRGCPYCSHQRIVIGENDLKTTNPELTKEWDYIKNNFGPEEVMKHTNKKVWWKCSKCGYEWQQSPNNRTKGHGCPCCSGRVPKVGVNDLATLKPNLALDWNYDKNEDRPENNKLYSHKEKYWKCHKCGYEWKTKIRNRVVNSKCPNCDKYK